MKFSLGKGERVGSSFYTKGVGSVQVLPVVLNLIRCLVFVEIYNGANQNPTDFPQIEHRTQEKENHL